MPPDIPEYYRHLAEEPSKKSSSQGDDDDGREKPRGMPIPDSARRPKEPAPPPPLPLENDYRANSFTLSLPDDWIDRTVYTLTGPVTDGVQHNITVTRQPDLSTDDITEFAELQIRSLEEELKGCRLLLKEPVELANGLPAYRALFVWWPAEEIRLYQEQLYVLYKTTGFTLTASFTKKTRKTIGPQVERAMMTFSPEQ